MNLHRNAALSLKRRKELCRRVIAGSLFGPHRIPHRTSEQRIQATAALRCLRFTGPKIAEVLGMSLSTVSGIL